MFKVPRSITLDLVTTIEEEIEAIDSDDKNTTKNSKFSGENESKWNFIFSWKYLLIFGLLMSGIVGMLYLISNHLQTYVGFPDIFDVSNFGPHETLKC